MGTGEAAEPPSSLRPSRRRPLRPLFSKLFCGLVRPVTRSRGRRPDWSTPGADAALPARSLIITGPRRSRGARRGRDLGPPRTAIGRRRGRRRDAARGAAPPPSAGALRVASGLPEGGVSGFPQRFFFFPEGPGGGLDLGPSAAFRGAGSSRPEFAPHLPGGICRNSRSAERAQSPRSGLHLPRLVQQGHGLEREARPEKHACTGAQAPKTLPATTLFPTLPKSEVLVVP